MGTTCGPKPANVKQYLMDQYTYENELVDVRAVDCKIVNLRTAYLAVNTIEKDTGKRYTWASVVLLSYAPGPFGFCEKHISEDMGPVESKCPKSILQILSPTESEYAREWRGRCWENIDNPAQPITVKTEFGEPKHYQKLNPAIKYARKLARTAGDAAYITIPYKDEVARYGISYYGGSPWHVSGPKILVMNGEVL